MAFMTVLHEKRNGKIVEEQAYILLIWKGVFYVEHPIEGDMASICIVNKDKTYTETGLYDTSDIFDVYQ